jgi:hypothetical protein
VPVDQAERIYDLVARNWRETARLLNLSNGTNFTAAGVEGAVNRSYRNQKEGLDEQHHA